MVQPAPEIQPDGIGVDPMVPGVQPEPLAELGPDERAEWQKFTKRMPVGWFPPETWPLLAQLCRHVCQSRWFGEALQEVRAGILADLDDDGLERVERLMRCHREEGRAISSLMIKLRLTPQTRIEEKTANKARQEAPEVKPWETMRSSVPKVSDSRVRQ